MSLSIVPIFLIGMMSLLVLTTLPSLFTLILLIILIGVLFAIIYFKKQVNWVYKTTLFLVIFLSGFLWFSLNAMHALKKALPQSMENIPLQIVGKIASLPAMKQGQLQFQFKIEKIIEKNAVRPCSLNVLLIWTSPASNLKIGEVWSLQAKLKRPHAYANPGSFDREAWLFQNGIQATGYVLPDHNNFLYTSHSFIQSIRQYYDQTILNVLNNLPFGSVIDALTVGNSASISQAQWQVFRNTGTSHLVAISGLHIGMIAGLFYFIFTRVWRFSSRLCEYWPAPKAGAFFAMLGAFLYTSFSGFSIPAERTFIMLVALMSGKMLGRYSLASHRFMVGLAIILLLHPFSIMNNGFWLSFSAIALIGYGMSGRLSTKSLWWRFGRVQWVASLGLLPLSCLLFQQSSLVGWFANFIAIPWVGWITVPFALLGCVILPLNVKIGNILLIFSEHTLQWLWPYLHVLSNFPHHSLLLSFHTAWLIIPSMVAVLLLLAPTQLPVRWLGIVWFLPAFFIRPIKLPENAVKLTILDVGQGLSIVIQTQNHLAVYDTGIGYVDGYNMGDVVLMPFFRNEHINKIDKLIISHGDADHAGGATALFQKFPNFPVLTSAVDKFKNQHAQFCEAGQSWQWDGVKFKMLYPFTYQPQLDNNSSCVLQIQVAQQVILLPGDIEKAAEQALLKNYPNNLSAYLLVAPHHGSISSSSEAFVQNVHPSVVVFATGYFNRYHFPSPQIVHRYQSLGSTLYNTAQDGAITFIFEPNKPVKIETYRGEHQHFWNTDNNLR